jgi:uroporphyrinogen-III synthase
VTAGRLAGWRVLVTRQPEQAQGLAGVLSGEGATVVEVPLIEIAPPADSKPLEDAAARVAEYNWLVFTSANAVRALATALRGRALPSGRPQVATVGPSTTRAVEEAFPGASVTLTPPEDTRAEGLVAAFAAHDLQGRRVLVPVSDRARDTLAAGLTAQGARVDVVPAYRTITPADAPARLAAALSGGVGVVVLASPSAVEGFVSSCPAGAVWPPVVAIGPVTERAARTAGLRVAAVASSAGPEGLLEAIVGLTRPR